MNLSESPKGCITRFEVLGETFTYPSVVQDLVDGITILEFLKKNSHNQTNYDNSFLNNFLSFEMSKLDINYIFKLIGSLDWKKYSLINLFIIGSKIEFNNSNLEELAIYTKDKLGESFLVSGLELKSLTKSDREFSISLLHFYLSWLERRKGIEDQINKFSDKVYVAIN